MYEAIIHYGCNVRQHFSAAYPHALLPAIHSTLLPLTTHYYSLLLSVHSVAILHTSHTPYTHITDTHSFPPRLLSRSILPFLYHSSFSTMPFDVDDWVVDQVIKDSLSCSICSSLLYQPVNLSTCCHTYCLHCLQELVRVFHRSSCPQCNTRLSTTIQSILSTVDCINGFCNEQLRKVEVSCPHCKRWKDILGVDRAKAIKHHNECGEVLVQCQVGCGQSLLRRQLDFHENDQCPRRLVTCNRCQQQLRHQDMDQHHINEQECESAHLCKLGCEELVVDLVANVHSKEKCSHRLTKCPVCEKSFPYHLLESHLQSNVVDHFTKLATDNVSLKSQLADLQSTLQGVNERLLAVQTKADKHKEVHNAMNWFASDAPYTEETMKFVASHIWHFADDSWVVTYGCVRVLNVCKRYPYEENLHLSFIRNRGLKAIIKGVKANSNAKYMTSVALETITKLVVLNVHDSWVLNSGCDVGVVNAITSFPTDAVVQENGYNALASIAKRSEACCHAVVDKWGLENVQSSFASWSLTGSTIRAMLAFLYALKYHGRAQRQKDPMAESRLVSIRGLVVEKKIHLEGCGDREFDDLVNQAC